MKFSLCSIYKNEEKNLERFIRNHQDLFDELILVDTGSTDRSNEIVESFGLSRHFFQWTSNFSEARNHSLSLARHPFIIVLDMDEWLLKEDFERLKTIIEESGKDAFSLRQINFTDEYHETQWRSSSTLPETVRHYASGYLVSPLIRVFRNFSQIHFRGIIHEIVGDSIRENGLISMKTDIPIYHFGWLQRVQSEEESVKKQQAYDEMIKKAFEKDPSPQTGYYYINSLKDPKERIKQAYRLTKQFPKINHFWIIIAQNSVLLNQWDRALSYADKGLKNHPEDMTLLAIRARCLNETGHPEQALAQVENLLKQDAQHPAYWFEKFRALVMLNRRNEAKKLFKNLPEHFPKPLGDQLKQWLA